MTTNDKVARKETGRDIAFRVCRLLERGVFGKLRPIIRLSAKALRLERTRVQEHNTRQERIRLRKTRWKREVRRLDEKYHRERMFRGKLLALRNGVEKYLKSTNHRYRIEKHFKDFDPTALVLYFTPKGLMLLTAITEKWAFKCRVSREETKHFFGSKKIIDEVHGKFRGRISSWISPWQTDPYRNEAKVRKFRFYCVFWGTKEAPYLY